MVHWCLHFRNNYIHRMYKMLILLKKNSEICLTTAADYSTVDDKLRALCGLSKHTASSEHYYNDATYYNITSSEVKITEPLIVNTKGLVVNIFPSIEARAKKSWSCNALCKVNNLLLIDRYRKFLSAIDTCTLKNVPKLMQKVYKCTVKTLNNKKDHTHSCYNNLNLCEAMSIPMELLSPHFPKVRYIRRLTYQLRSFYREMSDLDGALISADLEKLKKIVSLAKEKVDMYKNQRTDTTLSDDEIISKYRNAFTILKKRSLDTPRYICVSCERLCYKRNVSQLNKLRAREDIPIWKDLMAYVERQNNNSLYICLYCD